MSIRIPVELYVVQIFVFIIGAAGARWILGGGHETGVYIKRFLIALAAGAGFVVCFKFISIVFYRVAGIALY